MLHTAVTKQFLTRIIAFIASFAIATSPAVSFANPQDGTVAAGQATISENGTKLDVHQSTDKAVIDWRKFDIQAGEHTQFHQPSASSLTLNRVNSVDPSLIMGKMSANGNVVLVNPNGVFFGGTSRIDVNGIVASTANIGNTDFMSGNLRFNQAGNARGAIVNQGIITAGEMGLVGLVAPSVENNGIIRARLGKVTLASGDSFTLDMNGDNLIQVEVNGALSGQIAQNRGRIDAEGGVVTLTAAAARDAVNGVVSNSGIINANAIAKKDGKIILYAVGSNAVLGNVAASKGKKSGTSTALNSGTLTATGEQGGTVKVLGDHVGLMNGSRIDVSGTNGGGEAYVGGDYQGKGDTPTATRTIIQANTMTNADAKINGKGGKVIAWADDRTDFNGQISAKGGAEGGDGGFIETSGKNLLSVGGNADASSAHGKAGEWLLDPNDVTIQTAGVDTNVDASFTTTDDTAIVTTGSIEAALNAGTSVTITTSTAGTNAQSGNITVANSIAKTAGGEATLTLVAHRSVIVNSGSHITSNSNKLNVVLNADSDANNAGFVLVQGNITTNGGHLTMGGGVGAASQSWGIGGSTRSGIQVQGSTITTAGGNITMRGHGANSAGDSTNWGVYVHSSNISAAAGTFTVNGTGGNGIANNTGLFMRSGSTLSTTTGDLTVTAVGGAAAATAGYTHNYGIYLYNSGDVISSAGGNLTVTGTGANAYANNYGIAIWTNSRISNNGGALNVRGTGGNGASTSNIGINMVGTATISHTNAGATVVQGFGGSGGGFDYGMILQGSSTITTDGGALTVNGTGGMSAATSNNYGIYLSSGGDGITSTAGTGVVTVTGVGGNGTSSNYGIYNSSGIISTLGANLIITGTGGNGSSSNNVGIYHWGTVSTTTGHLTMNGTAGTGTSSNSGIYILGTTTTTTGNVTLTGTGNGTSSSNYGVYHNGTLSTTTGNIFFTGVGGAGTSGNYGTRIGTVSTTSGNITVNGTGGNGSSTTNYGNYIGNDITSGGASIISITSSGKNGAVDLFVTGARTIGGGSATGSITLTQDSATWGSAIINTSGATWFKPRTLSTTIGVAGGAGTLGITSAVLTAMLRSSDITIGDTAGTGLMTVNAYTWGRALTLQTATGGITFNGATDMGAFTLLARTYGLSDITIDAASSITTSAAGNALILASGRNFINNSNSSALVTSVGRMLVYSTSPVSDTYNGLARATKRYNKTYAGYAPGAVVETGNVFLYSVAPTITVTSNASKTVGEANPAFTASYSGLIDGDTAADALTGSALFSTAANVSSGVGAYTITSAAGTLAATAMGYQLAYVDGALNVYAAAVVPAAAASIPVDPVDPVVSTPTVTVSSVTTTEDEETTTPTVQETAVVTSGLRTAIAAIESTSHFVNNSPISSHAAAPMTILETRLAIKSPSSKRILDFDIITISPELQAKLKIELPSLISDSRVKPLIEN